MGEDDEQVNRAIKQVSVVAVVVVVHELTSTNKYCALLSVCLSGDDGGGGCSLALFSPDASGSNCMSNMHVVPELNVRAWLPLLSYSSFLSLRLVVCCCCSSSSSRGGDHWTRVNRCVVCVLYLRVYGRYVKLVGGKRGSVIDKPTVTRYSLSLSWLGLAWLCWLLLLLFVVLLRRAHSFSSPSSPSSSLLKEQTISVCVYARSVRYLSNFLFQ